MRPAGKVPSDPLLLPRIVKKDARPFTRRFQRYSAGRTCSAAWAPSLGTACTWLNGGHAESAAFTLPDLFVGGGIYMDFLIRMNYANPPLLFFTMPEAAAVLTI